jgi:3'-phosphoadenosine 5'-phosphosulfate sulfotransferase (PAPS reductase)/FAD synthetase
MIASEYDHFIVAYSDGKDSTACFLHLLDLGVPPEKIELWHHDIDGREASPFKMDWPCTPSYAAAFAEAFGVRIYFSWREGGFDREMMRNGTPTARTRFETPFGLRWSGGNGKPGTRLKFPQVSADLSIRWCSPYLKIDVARIALNNQARFNNSRTLFITGERAEESSSRSRYAQFEVHHSDSRLTKKRRHIDQWRPVHQWPEARVWDIMRAYGINPHPAYRLGWERVSCMSCIFGNANQWASVRAVSPEYFSAVDLRERLTGVTIHRSKSVRRLADAGLAYPSIAESVVREAICPDWKGQILLPAWQWQLPAGAFGDKTGPS